MSVTDITTIPKDELTEVNLIKSAIFLGTEFAKVSGINTINTIEKLTRRVTELTPEDAYNLLTRISRIIMHKKGVGDPSI